jgi:signal transduction histidine kinase
MRTLDRSGAAVTGAALPERASGAGTPRGRLVPSVRALARELAAAGVDTGVRVSGRAWPLPADAERALARALRAAAVDAVRHGRARVVTVAVTFEPVRVLVVVRDDGAAPAARPDAALRTRRARRDLAALGGGLEIAAGRRTGSVVRAWVPSRGGPARG